MLINLYKKLKHGTFELDLPSIYFKPGQMIAVSEMFVMFHKNKGNTDSGVFALVSSLVDKSPSNLKQELLFALQDRKHHVHITPTQRKYYKIQCLDLKSSFINLIDLETDKNVEDIQFIYLQLEVIDGIQQDIKTAK